MKVAFVNQPWNRIDPPIRAGSIAIWTYHVANRLAARHSVTMYGRAGTLPWRTGTVHEGVEYRRIHTRADAAVDNAIGRLARLGVPLLQPFFGSPAYYALYALQVARHLRETGCDVVHIQNFSQFAPVIRACNPNARVVLHMHCEWLSQLRRAVIEKRLRSVDLIVGCSDYISNKIRTAFPEFSGRCHTAPNGVGTEEFYPDTAAAPGAKVLFVGRLSPEKGLDILIDAFALVAQQENQATLDLIGPDASTPVEFLVGLTPDGPIAGLRTFYTKDYYQYLQARVPPALRHRVRFRGPLPHDELTNEYRDAAVVLNPSFSESFGMSLIEAMASGKPVVATRVGGMTEVVEGVGLLTEPGDVHGLAEAILSVIRNRDLQSRMGAIGRERVLQRYCWNRVAERVEHLYQQCLAEPRKPLQAAF